MRPSNLLHACLLLCCAARVDAATFTVDTTADSGANVCSASPNDCSLRGALAAADGAAGADTVAFNIPLSDAGCVAATGVCRITLVNGPLNLGTTVTVDGYTQPGAMANSNSAEQGAMNGSLRIELVPGPNGGDGFQTNAPNFTFTLRGLALARFGTAVTVVGNSNAIFNIEGNYFGTDAAGGVLNPRQGTSIGLSGTGSSRIGGTQPDQRNLISNSNVGISVGCCGHLVQGNLIGTNLAGTLPIANLVGIQSGSNNLIIGGSVPGSRNVISGNLTAGIAQFGGNMSVRGNFIGTDAGNAFAIANGVGVQLRQPDTVVRDVVVGGTAAGEGNVIAFNTGHGVQFDDAPQGNRILGNSMRRNGGLGIAFLRVGGHTPNDLADADEGINRRQNFPVLSSFARAGNDLNLGYRVDSSIGNSAYPLRIEFFKADGDEGRDLLGVDSYAAGQAQALRNVVVPIPSGVTLGVDDIVIATATDAQGNTSELSFSSTALAIATPVSTPCTTADSVFCDGFESGPQASLAVRVTATALNGAFAPLGTVSITDNRGSACSLELARETTLASGGTCVLPNSGAPGNIQITAQLDPLRVSFADPDGAAARSTAQFVIP